MIKEIEWNNSEILGNLRLSLVNRFNQPYNTIIIAGDNGTGKTTILNDLATFLDGGSIYQFSYIRYEAGTTPFKIVPSASADVAKIGFHERTNENNSTTVPVSTNKNNNASVFNTDINDLRFYGFAYSKARSGFHTEPVRSVTSMSRIDGEKFNADPDNQFDFTELKQLIVDIVAQDNSEFVKLAKTRANPDYPSFQQSSKMHRFERAFNNFFQNMSFDEVADSPKQEKEIYFEKYGKRIPLERLSTGEKQIVFRGTQLLKNTNRIRNGTVLIDEPELSMHPKWQNRILNYYRDLFTDANGQFAQIFIATHSEYVIKEAMKDPDNVLVIILKENHGVVSATPVTAPFILPRPTLGEIVYNAFDICTNDYHNQLYCYYQTITHTQNSIKACDSAITRDSRYDPAIHRKPSSNGGTTYETLPTFVRNKIDHDNTASSFTDEELRISTELLIEMCR